MLVIGWYKMACAEYLKFTLFVLLLISNSIHLCSRYILSNDSLSDSMYMPMLPSIFCVPVTLYSVDSLRICII